MSATNSAHSFDVDAYWLCAVHEKCRIGTTMTPWCTLIAIPLSTGTLFWKARRNSLLHELLGLGPEL